MLRLILITTLLLLPFYSQEHFVLGNFNKMLKDLEINRENSRKEIIISILIELESENIESAINGDNVGVLQIRPIMVREVNSILGYDKFKLEDRYDRHKSIEMFKIFTDHHTPDWNLELVARRWNGGYRGEFKQSTIDYYRQTKERIENYERSTRQDH